MLKKSEIRIVNNEYKIKKDETTKEVFLNEEPLLNLKYIDYLASLPITTKDNSILRINKETRLEYNQKLISNKTGMYKKYIDTKQLKFNNKYHVLIKIKNETIKWSFQTKYNPFFSTVNQIKRDIFEFIQGFTDEYIESVIYKNSLEVLNLVNSLKEQNIENVKILGDLENGYTTTDDAVKKWVRFKTDIDLLLSRYLGQAYKFGSEKKQIGDINIEKQVRLPYLKDLLDRFEEWWEEEDEKIKGVNKVSAYVKGITKYKYTPWDRKTVW